jgi:M-phase inducer tyrosine phosphatase
MAMLSSPLAAMQPPPPPWTCARDAPARTRQTQSGNLGSVTNFNFAELGMRKSQPDYFAIKNGSVRGSSPTASLAADLSQNFYIDQRYGI